MYIYNYYIYYDYIYYNYIYYYITTFGFKIQLLESACHNISATS